MRPEPLMDRCAALGALVRGDTGDVSVEGWAQDVAPPSATEASAYAAVADALSGSEAGAAVVQRWAQPALTVHHVSTSAVNDTVIPRSASAVVSVRTVPHQTPPAVTRALVEHLLGHQAARAGNNTMSVRVLSVADWWIADPSSPHYAAAAGAIEEVWGSPPLLVREGGTMRVTPFLERELGAPALHLPVGQASDGAHQVNERIRLLNLDNGVAVMESLFRRLCTSGEQASSNSSSMDDQSAHT